MKRQPPLRLKKAPSLKWSGCSDIGRVRKNNEDAFLGLQFDAREIFRLGKSGEASLEKSDFFFLDELPPYDSAELIPKKGDAALAARVLEKALETLAVAAFSHDGVETALRGAAESLGIKAGQMFEPVRVAVCGRKTAPPLFGTLEALGRETCLKRIGQALEKLKEAKLK